VTSLLIATLAFVGLHFALSAAREPITARIGIGPFRGLYSLLAIATFIWMIVAYRAAEATPLWPHAAWSRWLAVIVMLFASILLVCGYLSPNPTAVGGERVLAKGAGAYGIFKVTRHPILWSFALWAAVHLIANGTDAALILFGGLLVLSLGGIAHIEAKRAADPGWQQLAASSSVIPFVAVAQGRASGWLPELGWWRVALGIAVYLVFLFGHRPVIGVPILAG
jgi:uncharacterized membrane protein